MYNGKFHDWVKLRGSLFSFQERVTGKTYMKNGEKDEEGINNERHNVGERSEGEGHPGDLSKLWNNSSGWEMHAAGAG